MCARISVTFDHREVFSDERYKNDDYVSRGGEYHNNDRPQYLNLLDTSTLCGCAALNGNFEVSFDQQSARLLCVE